MPHASVDWVTPQAHRLPNTQFMKIFFPTSPYVRNPLGKAPALDSDDGLVLYGSRVIWEYLNDLCKVTQLTQAAEPLLQSA
jgi:glutathione S-transferase